MNNPRELKRAVAAGSEIAKINATIVFFERLKALMGGQRLPVVEQIEVAAQEATDVIDAADAQIKSVGGADPSTN